MSGFLCDVASVFATVFPMSKEGTSHGSLVAANISILESVMPPAESTRVKRSNTISAWSLAAVSGTTPAVCMCSIWVCVCMDMSWSSLRRATEVSSQEDSKARRYIVEGLLGFLSLLGLLSLESNKKIIQLRMKFSIQWAVPFVTRRAKNGG